MGQQLQLGDLTVEVVLKNIKHVHLSVYPPNGSVRIAAPARMSMETIRSFAISKLSWIKKQQQKLQAQARETPRDYLERESHYVWGQRYLLTVGEAEQPPRVELTHQHLRLTVRPGSSVSKRQAVLEAWYREQMHAAVPPLISKWEPVMGVTVARFFVRHMKTRWGSCTPSTRSIRLNTDLAKKPRECLEYIIVHELAHLLEPTHNRRFVSLMERFMPRWQVYRDELNRLPVRHEEWVAP